MSIKMPALSGKFNQDKFNVNISKYNLKINSLLYAALPYNKEF